MAIEADSRVAGGPPRGSRKLRTIALWRELGACVEDLVVMQGHRGGLHGQTSVRVHARCAMHAIGASTCGRIAQGAICMGSFAERLELHIRPFVSMCGVAIVGAQG